MMIYTGIYDMIYTGIVLSKFEDLEKVICGVWYGMVWYV